MDIQVIPKYSKQPDKTFMCKNLLGISKANLNFK